MRLNMRFGKTEIKYFVASQWLFNNNMQVAHGLIIGYITLHLKNNLEALKGYTRMKAVADVLELLQAIKGVVSNLWIKRAKWRHCLHCEVSPFFLNKREI